jgi:putative component of membrane protein insertase Oxa1/YidC/SpoIIIJ protein YidD/TM2 domain-containing membrane protein YozV
MARYDALSVSGEWMIDGYKAVLSPLQGPGVCNFNPTCSQFARAAIRSQGFLPGVLIGADRLMRDNPSVWSYYDSYYTGEIVGGRIPDPVENHIAWQSLPDEPGLLVSAQPNPVQESLGPRSTLPVPDLSFADYLYSSGEYMQAADEYLRVRFTSGSSALSGYAGLMAGESYLRAGDLAQARHAFGDLDAPAVEDFRQYGIARTDFAAAYYAGTRASLGSIASPILARQAEALEGWTFFRQHRFAAGASALGAGTDEPSRYLSSMDGRDIQRRSRLVSTLMSCIVPGAGQLYSGRAGDGAYSFLTVVGSGLVTWWFAAEPTKRDPTRVKVSIFGVISTLFYAGNVYGGNIAARDYNLLQERRYVQRADSLFTLLSLEPDYHVLLDSVPQDTAQPGRK